MSASAKVLAFFGATGGCAGHTLACSLNAGFKCRALVRSDPERLLRSLREKGVDNDTLTKSLTTITGDGRSESDVARVLCDEEGEIVDTIVSGIGKHLLFSPSSLTVIAGMAPQFKMPTFRSPSVISFTDPTICAAFTSTVLSALRSLQQNNPSAKKPLLIAVSTVGISDGPREVPMLYETLFWLLGNIPHDDKKIMEQTIRAAAATDDSASPIRDFVLARPTVLVDGPGLGLDKVRCGTEEKPAVGWTIQRADVGRWIFEKCIRDVDDAILGRATTLTY